MIKYICELAHECDVKGCEHIKPHEWLGRSCNGAYCKARRLVCIEVNPVSDLFDDLCESL